MENPVDLYTCDNVKGIVEKVIIFDENKHKKKCVYVLVWQFHKENLQDSNLTILICYYKIILI